MIHVPCESCGALNRLGEAPAGKKAVCGKCKAPLSHHGAIVEVGSRGLATLVAKSPVPVVVDFWAEWCGPCRFFAPVFEKVAEAESHRAAFAKVDTERAPEAASSHGITAIPTLLVFFRGREIERRPGALSEPQFRDLLNAALAKTSGA